jgi:hypothetical protein
MDDMPREAMPARTSPPAETPRVRPRTAPPVPKSESDDL